jgi:hypothetical protein
MIPEDRFTDEEIQQRFEAFYRESQAFSKGQIPYFRQKLSNLSEFEISRINRFRYRTRYFSDSGVIGSKEFVAES